MKKKNWIAIIIILYANVLLACSQPAGSAVSNHEIEESAVEKSAVEKSAVEESAVEESVVDEKKKEELKDAEPSVTLVMVGDVLLHTPVAESGEQEDASYSFDALFAQTASVIQEADLALVNQEVILGGTELGISGYPAFNAPYELGDALMNAGFDVVLHGTNHALDKGKRGIENCLDFWEEKYPQTTVLGIHDSQEDSKELYVYEQDGMKIAILNYTYGTNGIEPPSDMPYAVDMLEMEKVAADIERAKELADFTIVCPHWGTEYYLGISSTRKVDTDVSGKRCGFSNWNPSSCNRTGGMGYG